MDSKPCIHCATPLYSENRCPVCGKNQKSNTVYVVIGVGIALIVLLCGLVFRGMASHAPAMETVTPTASEFATIAQTSAATATPHPTLTPMPVFPTPAGDEWVKLTVVSLLYAKSNTCIVFDANSLKTCGGKTIDLYVTHGYWHIAWVNHDNTITYTEITPGIVVTVTIPEEALDVYFGNLRP